MRVLRYCMLVLPLCLSGGLYGKEIWSCDSSLQTCQLYSTYFRSASLSQGAYPQGIYSARTKVQFLKKQLSFYLSDYLEYIKHNDTEKINFFENLLKYSQTSTYEKIQIFALPGSRYPGIFMIDGLIKSAVTKNIKGASIYFNTEFVEFFNDDSRSVDSQSFEELLSLLVHELGHHVSEMDHDLLNEYAIEFGEWIENKSLHIYDRHDVALGIIDRIPFFSFHIYKSGQMFPNMNNFSRVIVGDERDLIDITYDVSRQLKCQSSQFEPNGFEIIQLKSKMTQFRSFIPIIYRLEIQTILNCQGKPEKKKVILELEFRDKKIGKNNYYLFARTVQK